MMRSIRKHEIPHSINPVIVNTREGFIARHAALEHGGLSLWLEEDCDRPTRQLRVLAIQTEELFAEERWTYLATAADSHMEWHILQERPVKAAPEPAQPPQPPSIPPSVLPRKTLRAKLWFDGGCSPNPGPSTCGFVLRIEGCSPIKRSYKLGHGTNNTAEYQGLIHGLSEARDRGVTHLEVFGDSQVVIRGMNSIKKSMYPHIEQLKQEAKALREEFQHVICRWVPRKKNTEADALTRIEDR